MVTHEADAAPARGEPIPSCAVTVSAAIGKKLSTIEGLHIREHEAVKAACKMDVAQRGYCQSYQIMSASIRQAGAGRVAQPG